MRRQWVGWWLALVMLAVCGCGGDDSSVAKRRRLAEEPPMDVESSPRANATPPSASPAPDASPAPSGAPDANATPPPTDTAAAAAPDAAPGDAPGAAPGEQPARQRRGRRPAFENMIPGSGALPGATQPGAAQPGGIPPANTGPPPQGVAVPRLGAGILRALTGSKKLPAMPGAAPPPAGSGAPGATPPGATSAATFPDQAAAAVPADVSLMDQAKAALKEGDDRKGLDLLMADGIVRGHDEVLSTVRWSRGLKRPMLFVRCGLVVLVAEPASQTSTGSEPAPAASDRGGRRGASKSYPRGGATPPPAEEADKGEKSDKALTAYWDEAVVQPLLERWKGQIGQGAFGVWLKGAEVSAVAVGGSEPGTRSPGLVILTAPNKDDALKQAETEGLDAMFVATVAARGTSARGPTQTSFALRMYEPGKEAEVWTAKVLNDMRLKNAKDGGKAVIGEYLDEVMKQIDDRLQLVDLPPIGRDAAVKRANSLTAKKLDRPLPALLELRLYESRKLLTEAEAAKLYAKLVESADATKLASGTPAERREVIARLLPTGAALSPAASPLPGGESPAMRRPGRQRRGPPGEMTPTGG